MPLGTVKFFNTAKGFGFITPDEGSKDVFVPAASVVSAGVASLNTGQRVSFEAMPDSKGPKAVNLVLISNPHPPKAVQEPVRPAPEERRMLLTFFHGHYCDWAPKALAEIRAAGYEPRVIDYIASPPTRDELKILSFLLRDSAQSLVRKYDPLFHELRLDDRFISENEFWEAVVEHPSLINGPIVATATNASILRSENSVNAFLAVIAPARFQAPRNERAIPERTSKREKEPIDPAQVARREEASEAGAEKAETAKGATETVKKVRQQKARPAPAEKPKTAAGRKSKSTATKPTVAKTKAKPAIKKIAAKPTKTSRRTAKK